MTITISVLGKNRFLANPKKDKDYYTFLKRIGYAENMDSYNAKVRAIANTL